MEGKKVNPTTVDEYIAQFPGDVQQILVKTRAVISVHFPLDEPIPYELIGKMIKLRVEENLKISG